MNTRAITELRRLHQSALGYFTHRSNEQFFSDLEKIRTIIADNINNKEIKKAAGEILKEIGNMLLHDADERDLTGEELGHFSFKVNGTEAKLLSLSLKKYDSNMDLYLEELNNGDEVFRTFYELFEQYIKLEAPSVELTLHSKAVMTTLKQLLFASTSITDLTTAPVHKTKRPAPTGIFQSPTKKAFLNANDNLPKSTNEKLDGYLNLLKKLRRSADNDKFTPYLNDEDFKKVLRALPVEQQAEIYLLSLKNAKKKNIIDFIWQDNILLHVYLRNMRQKTPLEFEAYHDAIYKTGIQSAIDEQWEITMMNHLNPNRRR